MGTMIPEAPRAVKPDGAVGQRGAVGDGKENFLSWRDRLVKDSFLTRRVEAVRGDSCEGVRSPLGLKHVR